MPTAPVRENLYNAMLEQTVLAGCFIDPDQAERILPELDTSDFHSQKWSATFEAMERLHDQGQPVDYIGIVEELREAGQLDMVGGQAIIAELAATDYGQAMSASYHARRLRVYRRLREREALAKHIMENVYSGEDIEAIDASIEEYLVTHRASTHDDAILYGWDTIQAGRQMLADLWAEQNGLLDWPWASWNKRVRPLMPGQLGILAAPDSMGKSTYLDMIAGWWAQRGKKVIYIHLEDDHTIKVTRRLSCYSYVPWVNLVENRLTEKQRCMVTETEESMKSWADNLHYVHAAGWTMRQITKEIKSLRKQGLCDVVVLDYLDKTRPDQRQAKLYGTNSWERQADDVETLKSCLEQLHIPGFTATQGNKSMQNDGMQTRQAIQGSGQKSQKSQLVMILTRELLTDDLHDTQGNKVAEAGEYSPHANIRIDKQNLGRTGQFQQYFHGPCYRIADLEEDA